MQPPSQVADLDGQPWVGQVRGHAINPPVQPQPATTLIGGQLLEESPAAAGQAARQPDTGRLQVRGEGYFRAHRLFVRFPEQFFDGVAFRAQIQAPDSSHRTPRHRDERGSGFCRQPECAADELDALAAATDHAPRQPAADDRGNLPCLPRGQARALSPAYTANPYFERKFAHPRLRAARQQIAHPYCSRSWRRATWTHSVTLSETEGWENVRRAADLRARLGCVAELCLTPRLG